MSNWGEAHKDETAKRIRQFWEQNESLKNSEFQPCPQLVNSSMQVGLFVGLTMGITHRLKEMTTTPDSIAKLIPVDESQRDRFPTLSRSFGRILLSGIKGSATAAIFSASYCTLQAYNINFETSISTAGFIAAASAGSFWKHRALSCLGFGLLAGVTLQVIGMINKHNGQNIALKYLRIIHKSEK